MPNRSGFSLIEVVIATSISALIFMLISGVYILSQRTYSQTDTKAELNQNGRVILDRMIREIRQTPDIITQLPPTNAVPSQLPSEITFQDGHDMNVIQYIRYFMDGTNLKRQLIVFYFPSLPDVYVHSYQTDSVEPHNPPIQQVLEEKIIGEYLDDIEFWGASLVNINLYLTTKQTNIILFTSVYGRNL